MPEASSTVWLRHGAMAIAMLGLVMLTACETTNSWLQGRKTHSAEVGILGAPDTGHYVSDLYDLVNGDPATQAEIYADAKSRAQLTPDPSTELRYALVLAAPGHAETNELEAQKRFRELLAQTELLTPAEISLATIHLRDVEERLVMIKELRRLRAENTRASNTADAAIARRIAEIEADNRRLRRSLDDAEQKLDAITSIERSVREPAESQ
jgi:hypothetical protein